MQSFSAIGLFCEDIREEKSGQDTLVGILPDNVDVPSVPGVIPKIGLYVRVHIYETGKPQKIRIRLKMPGGEETELANLDNLIDKSKKEAAENAIPYAGIISKSVISPFKLTSIGKVEAILEVDDEEFTCGALNIRIAKKAQPAT